MNATPNSATADPANNAGNSVATNNATTGTTANAANSADNNVATNNATTGTSANTANNTATNTVGSLVRLNRDNDAASATFETPYADAYNSYTSAWRNTGNNPLKNSSYLPETAQTEKAVNQYLADTVAHNPYAAAPAAALTAHQDTRREQLDNHARPSAKAKPTPPSAAASPTTTPSKPATAKRTTNNSASASATASPATSPSA